jgi:hypothetical protein
VIGLWNLNFACIPGGTVAPGIVVLKCWRWNVDDFTTPCLCWILREAEQTCPLHATWSHRLSAPWQIAAKSFVIEPELDVWVWGADNAVEAVIEWPPGQRVRDWLRAQGFNFAANHKPSRPKEAFEVALRIPGLPRSSSIYQKIAEKISLQRCSDPALIRLRQKLVEWFPPQY